MGTVKDKIIKKLTRENLLLQKKTKILSNMANIDSLTLLYNHKCFHSMLSAELLKARRFNYSVSIVMMDIDDFKKHNDKYGHPSGDKILKKISQIIKKTIRSYDVACRYGGEEFSLILPHTSRKQAIALSERIRKAIATFSFKVKGMEKVRITLSLGIACFPINANLSEKLIERADKALYLSKEDGKNRVSSSLIASRNIINFGFCPPAFTSVYYSYILKGIREVIEDVGDIKLNIKAPDKESDYNRMSKIFDNIIKNRVDALAFCSMAGDYLSPKIRKAKKAGIPVFAFNMPESLITKDITSHIGYNHKEAGEKIGSYICRLLRGKGKIVIIEGLPEEITSIERVSGMSETFKVFPEIKVLVKTACDWDKDKARKTTAKLLKKHKNIDAICVADDDMAIGVAEAVSNAGLKGKIFISGIDGSQNAFAAIEKGDITATLDTNPVGMGKALMRTVIRNMIKDEKVSRFIKLPVSIVDLENVEKYIYK